MLSNFASNLRFLRTRFNIDEHTIARRFNMNTENWKALEEGRREPSLQLLIQISDFLGLSTDVMLRATMENSWKHIKNKNTELILLDVDGTMTDGGMYYGENGDIFKRFDAQDGLSIHRMITRHKMKFGFISAGSTTTIVQKRAKKLGVNRVYCGTRPKVEVATEWLDDLDLTFDQVAFIGDDLNDLPLIEKAGIAACPANARPQVKLASHIVLSRSGGNGCIREFIEDVMEFDILK